jgi:hypothetical protein
LVQKSERFGRITNGHHRFLSTFLLASYHPVLLFKKMKSFSPFLSLSFRSEDR